MNRIEELEKEVEDLKNSLAEIRDKCRGVISGIQTNNHLSGSERFGGIYSIEYILVSTCAKYNIPPSKIMVGYPSSSDF